MRIDSHRRFWRYDAVRDSWIADRMRVPQRAIDATAAVQACELSGLITEADWNHWTPELFEPYLGIAFDAFGSDRLTFGSDWPVCLLAGSYHRVKGLVADFVGGRPEAEQSKIFGETAVLTA